MTYRKFTVSNFRCFSEEQTLIFAQPIANKIGSGITYIVGANNSGKTTLIESLWMRKGQYLNDSERRENPPTFRLFENNNKETKISLLRENACRFIEEPERNSDELFEIVSSRRHWDPIARGEQSTSNIISSTVLGDNPRQHQNVEVAVFLKAIEADNNRYKEFTNLVKKIIPEFNDWALGFEREPYIKYISNDGVSHRADFLGDGVISIIRLLVHLFENRKSCLIIDEPELSLHPLAQKRLIKLIAEYAQRRQIIISTHSPYFLSWDYIENGSVLNRIAKEKETNSKIFTIDDFQSYKKLIGGGNWQQPYLMDIVSKEIFFQENVLFVEGQEDRGLLQSFFVDDNINFFGYGVRGYQNFDFALQLAKDLGFAKAGVLLDSASNAEKNNENAMKTYLEKKYENYKIIQWNKNDIRDKSQRVLQEKTGYFTETGKLKPIEQLDDFHNKIEEIKKYFKD